MGSPPVTVTPRPADQPLDATEVTALRARLRGYGFTAEQANRVQAGMTRRALVRLLIEICRALPAA